MRFFLLIAYVIRSTRRRLISGKSTAPSIILDRLLSAHQLAKKHVVEPPSTYFYSKKSWKNQRNGLSIQIRP